MDMYIIWGI